jgi:hypothetical protein
METTFFGKQLDTARVFMGKACPMFNITARSAHPDSPLNAQHGALPSSMHVDVHMYHFRDPILSVPPANSNNSITVIFGTENAAFSPELGNGPSLARFDFAAWSNIKTASVPYYSFTLPPSGHYRDVPSYEERPNFAMFAWSHCEEVRTEYARRMIDAANSRHGLHIAAMGKCAHNDDSMGSTNECPRYEDMPNIERWNLIRGSTCTSTTMPDVMARSYKFSLVFLNADCDHWADFRLQTAWSSLRSLSHLPWLRA